MAPDAFVARPGIGLGCDAHPGASQALGVEPVVKTFGQSLGHERSLIHTFDRWIEFDTHREMWRWWRGVWRSFIEASGDAMGDQTIGPEPGHHISGGKGGECTERADAEPT